MLTVGKWVVDPTRLLNEILTFFTLLWARWFDAAPASVAPVTNVLYADKRLAAAIGLEEAIIATRLLAWQRYNATKKKYETHKRDGKWYTYNSIDEWVTDFGGAFKATTMGRYLRKLETMKLIESGQFLRERGDMRKWYHVDEKALQNLVDYASKVESPSYQIDKMVVSKRHTTTRAKTAVSPNPQETKQQHQTPRAQNADDGSIPDSGDDHLFNTEGADRAPAFEESQHEADAAENPLPVPRGFPLPPAVQQLVDEHALNPATAAAYLEKHGVEHCERVAEVARRGHSPAGLWRDLLDKGDYRHVHKKSVVPGKIDDFIIK